MFCSREDQAAAVLAALAGSGLAVIGVHPEGQVMNAACPDSIASSSAVQSFHLNICQQPGDASTVSGSARTTAASSHMDAILTAAALFPQLRRLLVDLGDGQCCSLEAVARLLQGRPLQAFDALQIRMAELTGRSTEQGAAATPVEADGAQQRQAASTQSSSSSPVVDLVHLRSLVLPGRVRG
jgi:hypothetical protein